MKLLLLHGPNLGRLGERPGDEPGVTLESVEAAVRDEAARHGPVDVRALQSNHEGALLDALQAAHAWADGVVLNAGVLARTSWVLREAVACAGVPVVEVTLDVLEGSVAGPTKSLLEDVVVARTSGRGLQGYVEAVRWIEGQLPASAPGGASAGRARAGHQVVPGRPATTPRDCAFCAEEPCELHAGVTVLPARTVGLGLAGEAMMRLRALESDALLAETGESIAALLGGARTAEERFDAALGLSDGDGDGGPGVDDITAQLPTSRAPVAGERGEAIPPIRKSLGPGAIHVEAPSGGGAGDAHVQRRGGPGSTVAASRRHGTPPSPMPAGEPGTGELPEGTHERIRVEPTAPFPARTSQPRGGLDASVTEGELGPLVPGKHGDTDREPSSAVRLPHMGAGKSASRGNAGASALDASTRAAQPLPGAGSADGLVRKSIGPAAAAAVAAPRKTLGRAVPGATNTAEGKDSGATSRSQLARRLADHLSGALSASELAAFARAGWMALDDGAHVPASERVLLEPALRQLMFHDRPGAALDAPALVSLLASLQ